MRFVQALWFRVRRLLDRERLDAELDAELRDHIERATRANVNRGMTEREARRMALAVFGGVQRYKEETRDAHGVRPLEDAATDIGHALRLFRRAPGFAAVAVMTLALGVGVNTAMFTVVNGVLLRPLPFREPDRLFLLSYLPADLPFEIPPGLVDRLYLAYRARQQAFERVAAYTREQLTLSGVGDAVRLKGVSVGADFFGVLGISPVLGRGFTAAEEQPGSDRVVILGQRLWRERFGADPHVLGRPIVLDGVPHIVVGIAPPGFDFPASADLWTPMAIRLDEGNAFIFSVLGRLEDGVSPEQARAELASIARAQPRDPRDNGAHQSTAAIVPLADVLTRKVRMSLLVFSGAVAFVLLIAGTNVANLLLMRGASRRQELAVRAALGASRARLVRQLLAESLLLSSIGGAAGIGIAYVGVRTLLALAPPGEIPRLDAVHVDVWVLVFTVALSMTAGVVFGLVPALHASRRDPQTTLAPGARVTGGAPGRLRAGLVVAEIALALVLLTGAGLMVRSFLRMRSIDTGYDPARVVTMSVDLPHASYPDLVRVRQFHDGLLSLLRRIPGVRAAGAASFRPMMGVAVMGNFSVQGPTPLPHGYEVDKPRVSPGYFGAMGIRLLRGRDFEAGDDASAPGVVIVSQSVARRVWPGENAIGKRISMSDHPGPGDWLTVIGVVNDVVQDASLRSHSTIYLPYMQSQPIVFIEQMTFAVRTDARAAGVPAAMRAALRAMDPAVPAQALQTMDDSMLQVVADPLFQTRLLTAFSLLALLLAAIGTYGVLAYDVAERTREIAIRIALGAESTRVISMVVRRTLLVAALGVGLGGAGALAATRVLSRFLFEVTPTDPLTFASTAALLALVALAAGLVPARRASRVDPMVVLRQE